MNTTAANVTKKNSSKLPVIGMGHLYLQGANTSESEREVQLGNTAAVASSSLAGMFDYLALGHIHKPQQFDQGKIRYSGSPISSVSPKGKIPNGW